MQQQIKPAYRVPECIEFQSVQNIRVPEGMEYQSKKVDSFRWEPRVTSKELDTEMEEIGTPENQKVQNTRVNPWTVLDGALE